MHTDITTTPTSAEFSFPVGQLPDEFSSATVCAIVFFLFSNKGTNDIGQERGEQGKGENRDKTGTDRHART